MRILVTGATGLIGSALVAALRGAGEQVLRAIRGEPRDAGDLRWDAGRGFAAGPPEGLGAVVHLAGEPLAEGWWTPARKAALQGSRVEGTRRLAAALASLTPRPRVMVSGSAIGYYGDRGDETLTEASGPGTGFLAGLAREWEEASRPAADSGIRVVTLRTGLVLSPRGGALARLIPPFRLGLGGPFGHGRMWMSWIGLGDLIGVIRHALARGDLSGPVNAVAPEPVRNAEFARALGRALGRPARLPLPPFALRLMLGAERADQMLLASARAVPERLLASGFRFGTPTLDAALARELAGA